MNTVTHIDVFPGGGPKAGSTGGKLWEAKIRILQRRLVRVAAGAVLIAAVGLSWPSGANAFLITQTGTSGGNPGNLPVFEASGLVPGDSFGVTYDDLFGALDVTAMVTLDLLSAFSAQISVSIDNQSPDPDNDGQPRLTVFGLSISSPGFAGYSSVDASSTEGLLLDQFDGSGGFPGGFGDVVACATAASCTTGAGGGVEAGMDDAFILIVSGIFGPTLTLDAFAIKIQGGPDGANGDSYELPGTPSAVPLPAALPLFLSALAGLGLIGWRRNRAAA